MISCESCGGDLKSGAKFCTHCGATVTPTPQLAEEDYRPATESTYQAPMQGSYEAPTQGGYQASAQGAYQGPMAQTMVKEKKPANKSIFILGGIVIALIALAVILVLVFKGGKGGETLSSDPYVGIWKATSVAMMGMDFDAQEIYEKGFTLELKEKNKCVLSVEGSDAKGTWKREDGGVFVDMRIYNFSCEINGSTMMIYDYIGSGMDITFVKEGASSNLGDSKDDIKGGATYTSVQEKWNGNWYGYFWATEAYNEWAEYEDAFYDANMVLDVDEEGYGKMQVFLEDDEIASIYAYIYADDYHFEVIEGVFWDMELNPNDWWLGISPVDEGNLIVFSDIYIDPELTEDDGFEYICCFRPFGELWTQEEKDGELLPPSYYDYVASIDGKDVDAGDSTDLGSGESGGQWDDYYGSGEADNAGLRAGWNSVSAANTGPKPSYEELCEIIGSKGRLNEYADPKEGWLRVEWGSGTGFLRVDYKLEDGKLVYVMAEQVGSID